MKAHLAVLLLVEGVAAGLRGGAGHPMTVYEHMQQASRLGVKCYACSDALGAHAIDRSRFVPEVTGIAGATAFLGRALDPDWTTLIF